MKGIIVIYGNPYMLTGVIVSILFYGGVIHFLSKFINRLDWLLLGHGK